MGHPAEFDGRPTGRSTTKLFDRSFATAMLVAALASLGCDGAPSDEVVVYCSLDRSFAEPILKRFESETGVTVRVKYDSEATKSVGLTALIEREANDPRCDVFWNNEVINMIRLERAGRLDESAVPEAVTKQYPANYRSKRNRWHAFGGRARVLLVNNDKVPIDERPKSFDDLPNLARRRSVAIAKPTFGMTATHAAAIFAIWGDDRAKKWFRALKSADVKVLAGNKQSAEAVGAGSAAIGLTDTDDALDEIAKERNVTMIVPPIDGSIESSGALIIPNSVAKIEGCRHPRSADRLIAFLLRAEIEDELSRSAGMVGAHVDCKFKPAWINERFLRADVDFERVADCWNDAMEFLRDEFLSP